MTQTKREWRALLTRARGALEEPVRRRYSSSIRRRCAALTEFAVSRTLVLYEAIGAEVDLGGLAEAGRSLGKAVFLPGPDPLPSWVECSAGDTHRVERNAVDLARPLLIVVPGIGFDRYGTRLGRGRGYYDRALAALRDRGPIVALGVAFEVQIAARLPRDPWDQPVNLILTERRRIVPVSPVRSRHARHRAEEACEQ